MPEMLTVTRVDGDIVVIKISGVFDSGCFTDLQKEVHDLNVSKEFNLVFDLTAATFLSSLVVGVFFAAHVFCKKNGGFACLVGINHPEIKKMIAITRLDSMLTIYNTLEDALLAARKTS